MAGVKEELAQLFRSLSTASTIALSIVFSVFAGVLAGYYLDTRVFKGRTYPWLTIICLLLGIAGGAKNFFILTKRFSEEDREKKGPSGREGQRAGSKKGPSEGKGQADSK